jgi:hypothetical protein
VAERGGLEGAEARLMSTFQDVRRIALGLPEVDEILTWGTDVTFRIRSKIFVIGADDSSNASIKSTPFVQADLIDRDPATFAAAAYVGRFGWIAVDLERVDPAELAELIRDAWRRTAPKRLAASLQQGDVER